MASELRLRAEWRLGEMLIEMKDKGERHGGRGGDRRSSSKVELESLGVDKKLSSWSQKLAGLPENEFETIIAEHKHDGRSAI